MAFSRSSEIVFLVIDFSFGGGIGLAHAVTHAGFSEDVFRLFTDILDLLAQLSDIDAQILHVGEFTPDLTQEVLVRNDLAGVLHENA